MNFIYFGQLIAYAVGQLIAYAVGQLIAYVHPVLVHDRKHGPVRVQHRL